MCLWWAQFGTRPRHRRRQAGSYYQSPQSPRHEACKWQLTGCQRRGRPPHRCLEDWGTTSAWPAPQNDPKQTPSLGFHLLWYGSVDLWHSNFTPLPNIIYTNYLYELSLQGPSCCCLLPPSAHPKKPGLSLLARHQIPTSAGLSHHLSQLSGFHRGSPAPLWPAGALTAQVVTAKTVYDIFNST